MLSTNLVWLRKHYQYTQEEIAQQVGVSRQSVAKWESGESDVYKRQGQESQLLNCFTH